MYLKKNKVRLIISTYVLKFIKKVKKFCFLQDQAFCKQKVYLLGCITTPIE